MPHVVHLFYFPFYSSYNIHFAKIYLYKYCLSSFLKCIGRAFLNEACSVVGHDDILH